MLENPSSKAVANAAESTTGNAEIEAVESAIAGQLTRMVAELVLVRPPEGTPLEVQRVLVTARRTLAAVKERDQAA